MEQGRTLFVVEVMPILRLVLRGKAGNGDRKLHFEMKTDSWTDKKLSPPQNSTLSAISKAYLPGMNV